MRKKIILLFFLFFCVHTVFADTVHLKSGKTYQGKIVERNNQYIKMDISDVVVTFYLDEVNNIVESAHPSQPAAAVSVPSRIPSPVPLRPSVISSPSYDTPVVSGSPAVGRKSFLWKATSGNGAVYLLGSMHLAKKELYPLAKTIEEAFKDSDTVVVEVNINKVDQLQIQQLMLVKGMYQNNDSLDRHLSKETFALLQEKIKAMGGDILMFSAFKPWYVGLQLSVMSMLKLGYDPNLGIDKYFLDRASSGKRIVELESFDYQINLLSNLPDDLQELFVISSIEEISVLETMLNTLTQAWITGDAATMEEILFQSLKEKPELLPIYERIFTGRNKGMVSKIEGFLNRGGTYFVIVGAGHLVGDEGIIQVLQNKGFSVTQL